MTQMPQYGEGYNPVIDIDTHDFAFKMNLQLFSGGNWISVNAVDFVNNYASYAANVYGYIDNALMTDSNYYTFCNYYDTGDSIFSVKANNHGYRTTGYGSTNLGGHACSGTTTWSDKSIYQIATTTGWRRYTTNPGNFNMFIPYEIPEADGTSWTGNGGNTPACFNTAGIYTNHALLRYTDQRVFMPLKHILRDIIVNCGLVLLDSTDTKWISMVDGNGLCQGKLVLLSSDEAKESSIYNTRTSDNNLNPSPAPGPTPGYDDDPWSGVSFSGVGVGGAGAFARCYYMTATELANLRTWMSGIGVPEGFNPMAQIIGLSQVPVALSGDAPETVQFINSSAVYDPGVVSRVVDSGVSTQYSMGKPISYSLGSIDITRRMQERGEPYLDYSCQIELYLPLIGTFSLDTQAVMGRTLEAEAILDPISGTLAAYAWVTRDGQKLPVAYGSTTIGIDLPITAQQYSMIRAAAKQINAQITASMLSSALTTVTAAAAAGSASSAAAGRAGAASGAGIQPASQFNSYAQSASIAGSQTAISQSGNIFGAFMEWGRAVRQLSYGNNTAIAGSFGGSMAQWSYPFNAYVKIIRPRYEKPSNYNHTQGVPCVQTKTIGSCTGLIQCIGADVSGITRATDLERQAIQAALCNGVYAGGGE